MYRNTHTHNIDIRRSRCFYEGVLKSVEIFLFDPDWNIKLLTESPFNFIHTFVVSDRWIPDCDGPLAVPVHWGHLCHHCDNIHWRSLEYKLPLTDQLPLDKVKYLDIFWIHPAFCANIHGSQMVYRNYFHDSLT